MATSNRIARVAIVGAGGNSGSYMTKALLKTGKHTVTAITRAGGQSSLPEGLNAKEVDYSKPETLLEALKDQDALVITLSGYAPKDTETQLVKAAGEAGVPWVLPNDWSPDSTNEALLKDMPAFQSKVATRKGIADLGKSSYISVSTGFWYEWSLAKPAGFGIDLVNHAVTLFDEGETKISTSTVPQVGRAVAALLSLPVKAESNADGCLENFKNKVVYVNSFTVSQKDMLQSALRVTATKESEWAVSEEPAQERFGSAMKAIQAGDYSAFPKTMARLFYPDGCGDFEHNKGTINSLLSLPQEDIDEATKAALERSKSSA